MNQVKEFLNKHKMNHESIDMIENVSLFISEMEAGLTNNHQSLKMIPTHIKCSNQIPVETPIIVVDAGGTNLRTALLTFDKQFNPIIEDLRISAMPGSKKELSKEEFFEKLACEIERIKNKSNYIGFCFSYPTEILPNKDGRLIRFCKEIKAPDVEGQLIGENLLKAMNAPDKKVIIINDTVATLLGGLIKNADKEYDSYIGYILGTGTNSCYIESINKIKKLNEQSEIINGISDDTMIINIESGAYSKAPRGEIDEIFDKDTVNPGEYKFEKSMSGGYLANLIIEALNQAQKEGLLVKCNIKNKKISLIDINDFINNPYKEGNVLTELFITEKDKLIIYEVITGLIERAAKLAAINIIATVIKSGRGYNPLKPVCITVEGTTYYRLKGLKQSVEYYLREYLYNYYNINYELVRVDNATLLGTGVAGLTNIFFKEVIM